MSDSDSQLQGSVRICGSEIPLNSLGTQTEEIFKVLFTINLHIFYGQVVSLSSHRLVLQYQTSI